MGAPRPDVRYLEMTEDEREKVIEELRRALEGVKSVVFAYLHGGFVERRFFRDVDVAVWLADPGDSLRVEVDLSSELETRLGVPIDVHVLNEAPLPFRHHVFAEGVLLFSRDETLRLRLVDETLRLYFDLRLLNELASGRRRVSR